MITRRLSFLFPILYIIAWCISPPLSYGAMYRVLGIGCVVYLLIGNWQNSNYDQRNRLVYTLFIIAYMIIIGFVVEDQFVQRIHVYIFLIVGLSTEIWYNQLYPQDNYRYIILFTFTLYIIWNICAISALFDDDRIMRTLVRNSDISYSYALKGVGGYGYLYSAVIALPIGVAILLNKFYDKILRLSALIFVGTTLYLSVLSAYFMAEILAIVSIPLVFVAQVKSLNARILIYCIVLFGIAILFINLESVTTFLINNTESVEIQNKLKDSYMIMAEDGDIGASEFDVRAKRYGQAIDAFLNNPLFGCLTYRNVGNHSYILDYFGQYGILIGSMFLYLFFKPVTRYLKHNGLVAAILIVTLIVALFNILPLACIAPLYILLPAVCNYSKSFEYGK